MPSQYFFWMTGAMPLKLGRLVEGGKPQPWRLIKTPSPPGHHFGQHRLPNRAILGEFFGCRRMKEYILDIYYCRGVSAHMFPSENGRQRISIAVVTGSCENPTMCVSMGTHPPSFDMF